MGQTISYQEEATSDVNFTINGVPYTVTKEVPPGTSLNVFIRNHAKLPGTKAMCHEGGCGACIVAADIKGETMAVNSCLVPVFICHGWKVTTIEGLGNRAKGYHTIQAALADMNGSQCGFCSPGMVMNMFSLIEGKEVTMKEVENSFGSNICRCTGYRPILDAFKGFASDAAPTLSRRIQDIEDLYKIKTCPKNGLPCKDTCEKPKFLNSAVEMQLASAKFQKILSVDDLFGIFTNNPEASYVINGGNTAHGVYRMEKKQIYIDVNDIPDLHRIEKTADSLTLGAMVSLTVTMKTFEKYSQEKGFEYLRHLAKHIDLVASVPVRNIGTIAGNLMIKHQHHEFPSDIFLILEAAGADIHILESPGDKKCLNLLEFLNLDMKHKIIYSIVLPARGPEYEFRSYKVMPRAQNAHAHVNAGFLFKLDGSGKVLEKPNIIIGGIRENFLHATKTEEFLVDKSILDNNVLKGALGVLDSELNPNHVLPDYSPQFRKTLAEGLFYKFVLGIKPDNLDPKLRSGATIMERELSSGKQDYDTDRNLWPVNKPIPKLESIFQTSGEAQYTNDYPPQPNEVFCAFLHSDVANGKIASIDAKEALEMKGVEAFFTAKDIPGKNGFIFKNGQYMFIIQDELLFADGEVQFAGQPLGIVAARTQDLANEAVKRIKVSYTDALAKKPAITIKDSLDTGDPTRVLTLANFPAKTKGDDVKHVIKGEFECGAQYHFTMEPQTCVCIPTEDGMDVHAATQYIDQVQSAISQCLDVPQNSINVSVRRLGGAYGAKITRATQVAVACALVCHKLRRPARLVLTIESNMLAIGKRGATRQEYEIGVDDNGKIQYMNSTHWGNAGIHFNEMLGPLTTRHLYNVYDPSTWNYVASEVMTDVASNTYCRAPASTEGTGMIENIMEHIAKTVGKDPVSVRLANISANDKAAIESMLEDLMKIADYETRKRAVEVFNTENRWKKKGMAVVVLNYPLMYFGQFDAHVSIYARDGTVAVTHAGTECGQGINTKVAQAAAYTLGIDLKMVSVKPTKNITSPNTSVTGGSITSESCANATIKACEELLRRLEPIKAELKDPTWQELVMAAHQKNVDLCARYLCAAMDGHPGYPIYGVAIAEVEIDALTGQHIIQRVDLMEDTGISMNPEVDLGQVEGAFVMGIGYWTAEDLIYDPRSGLLTNTRTWNYKPPGAKDIPVDFRVNFRRNAPNEMGVLRSKATGEPPLCMSYVIPIAIRNAIDSARAESGDKEGSWYNLHGPVTTEKILLTSLTTKDHMVL